MKSGEMVVACLLTPNKLVEGGGEDWLAPSQVLGLATWAAIVDWDMVVDWCSSHRTLQAER